MVQLLYAAYYQQVILVFKNKSQTSANKYTNIQYFIWYPMFSVVFILFS